jgi:hypothetical protein
MSTIPTTLALDPEWVAWTKRYEWHLDLIPGLLEVMRLERTPLAASRTDKVIVSGTKGDGPPLPFRTEPVEEADDLWAALAAYVIEVSELLGEPAPHVLRASWWRDGQVQGIRASADSATARTDAFHVVGWLVDREELIAPHSGVQDSEEFLFGLIRKARARYQSAPRPRRARPRECGICGEQAVLIDWMDVPGGVGPALPVGRCSECGQQYEWRAEG